MSTTVKEAKEQAQATIAQGQAHFEDGIRKKGFRAFYLYFSQLRYFPPTLIYIFLLSSFFFSFFFLAQWEHNANEN